MPSPHTDACIRDAARFGYCEHTTLPDRPPPVVLISSHTVQSPFPSAPAPPQPTHPARSARVLLGFTCCLIAAVLLALALPHTLPIPSPLAALPLVGAYFLTHPRSRSRAPRRSKKGPSS